MPYIHIRIAGAPMSSEGRKQLFSRTASLMSSVMRKNHDLTVVSLEECPSSHWSVAGECDHPGIGAMVNIKITRGTNSVEEKAQMLKATHQMLGELLREVASPCYVVIDEVDANAWGYDGLSQAQRAQQSSQDQPSTKRRHLTESRKSDAAASNSPAL